MAFPKYELPPEVERTKRRPYFECEVELIRLDPDQDYTVIPPRPYKQKGD